MTITPAALAGILHQQREALRAIPQERKHVVPTEGMLLVAYVTTAGDTAFFNVAPGARRALDAAGALPWGA